MKKYLFSVSLLVLFILIGNYAKAQVFVVENASETKTYKTLEEAVAAAKGGDNIYVPGGVHHIEGTWRGYDGRGTFKNTLAITKPVNIMGAGYYDGGESSKIAGKLVFTKKATGALVSGILFNDMIYIDSISNMTINRCGFLDDFRMSGVGGYNLINECEFSDEINIQGISGAVAKLTASFTKNIIKKYTSYLQSCTFKNNIFLNGEGYFLERSGNCTYENNIFYFNKNEEFDYNYEYGSYLPTNSTFKNNLFIGGHFKQDISYNNTFLNNIVDQKFSTVFVNGNGGDYHLKATCLGKNAGTDGTDVGLYGTTMPFKENRVPSNPHFIVKSIATETDQNQQLPVYLKIEAQER